MLRHILILVFVLHCTAGVPLAQPKEEAKAQEMDSLFEDDINKRSKEVIMFGNQQNKGKAMQAGMIDSDLVPQDSNGSDDDDKNGHDEGPNDRSDDHKSNDQSQTDENEGQYESLNRGLIPVQGSEYSSRPYKEDVEDILPELIDAYEAKEDWVNYKKSPYDYYRDLVLRRKRSMMDHRHAMKKRNYVAAREHLIKRRSEKRSRFRRDLNLDEEELMQLINMLKERYPYERRRRQQYYRPDSDEDNNDDDDDDNREGFDAEELNDMFNEDARQELYNPYYYPTEDNDMPLPKSNTFHYFNDKDDDSDESDEDDDSWKQMGPARPIDLRRRSEYFYPPTDYRFMMIPGQKRRLPMHEEESEGLWGSFDDKRAVKKKKRGYYFGEGKDEEEDDEDDESDEEKLKQILELASYMNSHNRDYRSFR